MKIKLAVRT